MNIPEKETAELLNLFKRTTSEKEKDLGRRFFIQATHLPGYKETEFNALRRNLIEGISRQTSILDTIMSKNRNRISQIYGVLELNPLDMESFLLALIRAMDIESFRKNEFQVMNEQNYWNLRKKAEIFLGNLRIRKKMGRLEGYEVSEELKESLRVFMEAEYRTRTVERLCTSMKNLLLKQQGEIESVVSPGKIVEYMGANGIEQLKDVPESEKRFIGDNESTCNALLRCIHSEEVIGIKFKGFITACFNKTRIIERIVEKVRAAHPIRGQEPGSGLTQKEIDATL